MKTLSLIALVVSAAILPALAGEKPAPSPAIVETKAAKSDAARIAELEARMATLEKFIESLHKAASSLPAIQIPNAPVAKATASGGTRKSGPTDEDRKLYEALSETAKEKLRSYFREHMDELKKAGTDEQRRAMIRAAFDKIAAEDKAGKTD